MDKTRDQVKIHKNKLKPPNPTGKGGFQERPQDRNPGTWNPRNTFSFQMNRFKNMTITELEDWNKNTPKNVRTVAEDLAYRRVVNSQKELQEFREVADRTEGRAVQPLKHEGELIQSVKVEIINGIKPTSNKRIPKELPGKKKNNRKPGGDGK